MNNMDLYNAVRSAPENAIKPIKGGAYGAANLSDVNPQWRIQKMTEQFGPAGTGWIWEPLEQWTDNGVHYAHVAVQYKIDGGEFSFPVHGYGGTKIGGRDDSDLIKSSMTDAISNALRYIGVGADVWYSDNGNPQFDSKYSAPPPAKKQEAAKPPVQASTEKISPGQIKFIHSVCSDLEILALKEKYKVDSLKDIPRATASKLIEKLQQRREAAG